MSEEYQAAKREREKIISEVAYELSKVISELAQKFDLTMVEWAQIFQKKANSAIEYELMEQRGYYKKEIE